MADFQIAVSGISQLAIGDFLGVETVASTSWRRQERPRLEEGGGGLRYSSTASREAAIFHHYDSHQMTSGDYLI